MLPTGGGSLFSVGGFAYFDLDEMKKHPVNPYWNNYLSNQVTFQENAFRKGYYGWMGYGGSIMQWNPELKIGFGYIPLEIFGSDSNNVKASNLQQVMSDTVRKLRSKA